MAKQGGINKVILVGTLTCEPESGVLGSGAGWVCLSLATFNEWTDRTSGEVHRTTEYHRVKFYGNQAKTLSAFAREGDCLYIEGALRTRKWQTDTGEKRYTTEVQGNTFLFMDAQATHEGTQEEAPADTSAALQAMAAHGQPANPTPARKRRERAPAQGSLGVDDPPDWNDDLPF